MTAPARAAMMPVPRRSMSWDPAARVPDWVVLGRIREHLVAGLPVPESVCLQDEVQDYVPALIAAGHSTSEIEKSTGVNATRFHRRDHR